MTERDERAVADLLTALDAAEAERRAEATAQEGV